MKSSVITNENAGGHFVENYRFKVLGSEHRTQEHPNEAKFDDIDISEKQNSQEIQAAPQAQSAPVNSGFDVHFVEELLKKTDELSGNIIKLQMQIENQENEFNKRLDAEILRAKDDGRAEGLAEANEVHKAQIAELEARFSSSMQKLAAQYENFEAFLKKNEEELALTAINIAKEVVLKEISSASNLIAHSLASSLMKDIADAKDIEIRVSPADASYLKAKFEGKEHIKISADDAISKGGVVIISEAGNIDASIQTRLEKVKNLIGE